MFGFNRTNKVKALNKQVEALETTVGVLMASIDESSDIAKRSNANNYTTRETQVAECRSKYSGKSKFGNIGLQRVVNLRVAFSVPNRLFLKTNDAVDGTTDAQYKDAKDFLTKFMEVNGLDGDAPKELARIAELNGDLACELVWDDELKVPVINKYIWGVNKYIIQPANKNERFRTVPKLIGTVMIDGDEHEIPTENLCYITFNSEFGNLSTGTSTNGIGKKIDKTLGAFEGYPACGAVLNIFENLDKDLRDWRKVNFLFAHPTPHFNCDTQEDAKAVMAKIQSTGWRVGTAIATKGDFSLKGTSGVEVNLLMLSILTNVRIISCHTGISIHFLGFSNAITSQSTADSLGEPTEVVLNSEIESWQAFYMDMFRKAIRLRNKKLNNQLNTELIVPRIVPLTDRQWQNIKDIILPAVDKGLLSERTFLEHIPMIDVDVELERMKEEESLRKEKEAEDMKNNINTNNNMNNDTNKQDSNNNNNNNNNNQNKNE